MEQKALFLCCHVIVRTSLKTREDCSRSYIGPKETELLAGATRRDGKWLRQPTTSPISFFEKIKESRTGFHRPCFRRSSRVVGRLLQTKKNILQSEKPRRSSVLKIGPFERKPGRFCGRPNNCGILGNTISSQKAWRTSPTTPPPLLPTPYLSRPFAPDTAAAAALGQGRPVALVPWATPPPSSPVQIP